MDTSSNDEFDLKRVSCILSSSLKLSPRPLDTDEIGFLDKDDISYLNTNQFYRGRSRSNTQYSISRQRGFSLSGASVKLPQSPDDALVAGQVEKASIRSALNSRRNTLYSQTLPTFSVIDEETLKTKYLPLPKQWSGKYKNVATIGQGGFGSIYLMRSSANPQEQFAMKHLERTNTATPERLETELAALKKADHPNIVHLQDWLATDDSLYLIVDYCSGGCLFDRMLSVDLTEAECALIVKQILLGIAHLHSIGIVHRDIKLENILLLNNVSNTDIKISDFGICRILSDAEKDVESTDLNTRKRTPRMLLTSYVGTVAYMAPEMFLQSAYSEAVDLWALGVLVYMLLSFMSPFGNDENALEEQTAQIQHIIEADFNFSHPVWLQYSSTGQLFISRLLVKEAYDRYSANEALQHPWIRDLIVNTPEGLTPEAGKVIVGSKAAGWTISK